MCLVACLQVLADALAAGIDNFTSNDRANVKRAKKDLRISDTLAKECLATQVRHVLHPVKPQQSHSTPACAGAP